MGEEGATEAGRSTWMDGWIEGWVVVGFVYTQRSEVGHHSIRDSQGWLSLGSLHRQRVNVNCLCHGDKQHYTHTLTHTQNPAHSHTFSYLWTWMWSAGSQLTHKTLYLCKANKTNNNLWRLLIVNLTLRELEKGSVFFSFSVIHLEKAISAANLLLRVTLAGIIIITQYSPSRRIHPFVLQWCYQHVTSDLCDPTRSHWRTLDAIAAWQSYTQHDIIF